MDRVAIACGLELPRAGPPTAAITRVISLAMPIRYACYPRWASLLRACCLHAFAHVHGRAPRLLRGRLGLCFFGLFFVLYNTLSAFDRGPRSLALATFAAHTMSRGAARHRPLTSEMRSAWE